MHNLFILHSSRQIRPLFRVSVTGRPANVVSDAVQELPDCLASSDAILTELEEASLQTGVGFASEVADQSGPERSVSRLSGSPFGWPRPESVVPSSSLNPSPCQLSILWDFVNFSATRIGCSIQQFKSISLSTFYIVGFCPLFRLWDFVLWDSVLWDFVRRDFVLWDFVLWDSKATC